MSESTQAALAACPDDDCRCKLEAAITAAEAAGLSLDWAAILKQLTSALLPVVLKIITDLLSQIGNGDKPAV